MLSDGCSLLAWTDHKEVLLQNWGFLIAMRMIGAQKWGSGAALSQKKPGGHNFIMSVEVGEAAKRA